MSIRKIDFTNDEYYHVFNRGVDKRVIFNTQEQQAYFLSRLQLLNTTDSRKYITNKRSRHKNKIILGEGEQLVSIVAYCLLPNHFHLLLKQNVDHGISQFMQRLGTAYTMFFNQQEKRSGALFQGKFKATHLSGDFALPILSAYVNLNYVHHQIDTNKNLVASSLFDFISDAGKACTNCTNEICDQAEITKVVNETGSLSEYKDFIKNASKTFTDNKGNVINVNDFEF
ncbi:MAG: transposase [bacterium]|nr:transposase [Candidatus Thioglobus pontius]